MFCSLCFDYVCVSLCLCISLLFGISIAICMLLKDFYTAGFINLSDATLEMLKIAKVTEGVTEVPATWFSTLNSLFIIALAPLFSKWWESKYNPSAAMKYGIGLILLGLGFAILSYGASGIPSGAETLLFTQKSKVMGNEPGFGIVLHT